MTSHPSRAQHSHPHNESHPVFCNQQDKQVHSPYQVPDTGFDAAFGPDAGEQPACAVVFNLTDNLGGGLPNGDRFAGSDLPFFHSTDLDPEAQRNHGA